MTSEDHPYKLRGAIDSYYELNPDTLMPLLMLALAMKDKLSITHGQENSAYTVCSLSIEEIEEYEWVKLNPKLNEKVASWQQAGVSRLNVELDLDRSLYPISEILLRNDTKDIVQEHHHRMGRLVQHSKHAASDKAQRKYATYLLAAVMIEVPKSKLRKHYLRIFNYILMRSNLQPKRPRMRVAQALAALLNYDGEGLVYNPFAGCSIAGAMLRSRRNYYGDGDTNDKVYAAGLLLNYGVGVSNEHFMQRDSTLWLKGKKIDYVLSTYMGYIGSETAFDFCLGKCLADETFTGKYAGMVPPREIFDKLTANFAEALRRDWIDTIVLLPFGEAAVLVDSNKRERKKQIRLINLNNPLSRNLKIEEALSDPRWAKMANTEDAIKEEFFLDYFRPKLPEREGFEKVRLGDLVNSKTRKVYDLSEIDEDERVLAYINRDEPWYCIGWNENIKRKRIRNLIGPVYQLNEDCLIVNSAGNAEPRLFKADYGNPFFDDGYAFSLAGCPDCFWLANELKESYIHRQLHPYGSNIMVPEPLTEEDYLNLILFREKGEEPQQDELEDDLDLSERLKPGEDALEKDFVLADRGKKYRILNFIAPGYFGYTYRAEMLDCATGDKEIVAIKEFYPARMLNCWRENGRVMVSPLDAISFNHFKEAFRAEPEFIMRVSDTPNNHVTEVKSFFEYEPTGTLYYVMKYYEGESLHDMVMSDQVPESEQPIIEKILIPLCKALNAIHSHNILHLDIKPRNIVFDENDEAVLIDFGVSNLYGDDGRLLSTRGAPYDSPYSAPENRKGQMRGFEPRADIYGVAATLFNVLTSMEPFPIEEATDKIVLFDMMDNCSEQMKSAVADGLSFFANDRPANAQQFLNNFPGCENIKL